MKDIIGAISGIIALSVFISCILSGAALESALIRSIISLVAANLIGLAVLGLTVVTMYRKNNNPAEDLTAKDDSKEAPLKA